MAKQKLSNDYNTSNFYLLYGEEEYMVNKKVKEIMNFFLSDDLKDFNFFQFNEENCNKETLGELLYTLPIMTDKKVIHISQIEKIKVEVLNIISFYLNKNYDHTILILTGIKPDKRKGFFKDLEKNKKCYSEEFKVKNEREIAPWIKDYVRDHGRTIAPDAIMMIMQNSSASMNNLSSEIDKILTYCQSGEISVDTVSEIMGISKEYNIFKLQNAVVKRDLKAALSICENLLTMKENRTEPIAINLYLSKVFMSALEVTSLMAKQNMRAEAALDQLGYNNPWKDADLAICVKKFTLPEVIRALRYLLEGDLKLKSNYQDKRSAILVVLTKIINHVSDAECQYLEDFVSLRV